jgi:hypothetical protein
MTYMLTQIIMLTKWYIFAELRPRLEVGNTAIDTRVIGKRQWGIFQMDVIKLREPWKDNAPILLPILKPQLAACFDKVRLELVCIPIWKVLEWECNQNWLIKL